MKLKSCISATVVDGEPSIDFFTSTLLVERFFVADDNVHAGTVIALQNKLVGQFVKVDVIKIIPHAEERN